MRHAAGGARRAAAASDEGIEIGKDLSVCTVDSEGLGRFLCPSITSFERPNAAPFLSVCFDWIADGGEQGQVGSQTADRTADAAAVRRRIDGAGAEAALMRTFPRRLPLGRRRVQAAAALRERSNRTRRSAATRPIQRPANDARHNARRTHASADQLRMSASIGVRKVVV